jgi:spermidine/putrescine transport system permease protein
MTAQDAPLVEGRKIGFFSRLRESRVFQGTALISPANGYLFFFVVLPLIMVAVLSFLSRGAYGQVEFRFNPANYTRLLDPVYARILLYSFGVGFDDGNHHARRIPWLHRRSPARQRSVLLFLILALLDQFCGHHAWIAVARRRSPDSFLQWTGSQEPLGLYATAVMIGMVYNSCPSWCCRCTRPWKRSRICSRRRRSRRRRGGPLR